MRELSGIEEMTAASTLWDSIWARADAGHEVDPALMVALSHAGGYLGAAFEDGELIGAALGFWGSPSYGALHSHITGVHPAYVGRGVGSAIKQHQRAWVLERGGAAITWTYDPLVARNAHFNLNRLGARPERYLLDVYGELTDDLNRGDPSDRLLIRWSLTGAPPTPSSRSATPLVITDGGRPTVLADPEPGRVDAVYTVALPEDITTLRRRDPEAASQWRSAVREALQPLLDAGWSITGFDRSQGYRLEAPSRRS